MGKWDLLLPESELKELMLDKLLNRYLMITLLNQTQTNALGTCKKVAILILSFDVFMCLVTTGLDVCGVFFSLS